MSWFLYRDLKWVGFRIVGWRWLELVYWVWNDLLGFWMVGLKWLEFLSGRKITPFLCGGSKIRRRQPQTLCTRTCHTSYSICIAVPQVHWKQFVELAADVLKYLPGTWYKILPYRCTMCSYECYGRQQHVSVCTTSYYATCTYIHTTCEITLIRVPTAVNVLLRCWCASQKMSRHAPEENMQ